MSEPNTIESLLARVDVLASGCWSLPIKPAKGGYTRVKIKGRSLALHVLFYEHLVGPIPEGLVPDHLCRNRWCGNPAHVEPVTRQVNILRGEGPSAINARKTHCPQGHPYSGSNLYLPPSGQRVCRACVYARSAEWKRNKRRTG